MEDSIKNCQMIWPLLLRKFFLTPISLARLKEPAMSQVNKINRGHNENKYRYAHKNRIKRFAVLINPPSGLNAYLLQGCSV